MIKHIVMWTLKDEYKGKPKDEIANELKKRLLALENKIDLIKSIEVGINAIHPEKNHDVVLITEFDSFDDLANYSTHPDHMNVVDFVKEISTGRAAVDYHIS